MLACTMHLALPVASVQQCMKSPPPHCQRRRHQRGVRGDVSVIPCEDTDLETRALASSAFIHPALGTSSPLTRISSSRFPCPRISPSAFPINSFVGIGINDMKGIDVYLKDRAVID